MIGQQRYSCLKVWTTTDGRRTDGDDDDGWTTGSRELKIQIDFGSFFPLSILDYVAFLAFWISDDISFRRMLYSSIFPFFFSLSLSFILSKISGASNLAGYYFLPYLQYPEIIYTKCPTFYQYYQWI